MATANYVLIEKVTVGAAGASSISFSGIPQTGYTDLKVVFSGRETGNTGSQWIDATLTFNGSTTGYSSRVVYGSGGGTGSTTGGSTGIPFLYSTSNTATASTYGNTEFYVPNYTSSNYKSVSSDTVTENNATPTILLLGASLWSNTAAITSMTLTAGTSFAQNSTFYLYGVAKLGTTPAIVPYATGGDTIMTDGTYWYHAFRSSGTFTPQKGISCDVLLVAGGGGGGNGGGAGGGGGGAGGVRVVTQAMSTAQTVTIGAGGTGASTFSSTPTNGGSSSIGSIASSGGGYGGTYLSGSGNAGGSGGGGEGSDSVSNSGGAGNAGSYSPVEGFAGATAPVLALPNAAGGGGASAASATPTVSVASAGGAGTDTYNSINFSGWLTATGTGSSTKVGGGGGGAAYVGATGGAGGVGGGGTGETRGSAGQTAGVTNTGGGGGGAALNATGGGQNGGSGLVIVRYPV